MSWEGSVPVVGMLLQGRTCGPQSGGTGQHLGGWALEDRHSPGVRPREEQCLWAEQDGHGGCARALAPGGALVLTPPPLLPSSSCPCFPPMAQSVPPPIPILQGS